MPKRRRLNRELVITQAAALADEQGDAGAVSLAALAKALDVRPPSLYNHLDSMEDLQYALTIWAARRLMADLRQTTQGLVGKPALTAMAHAYRSFAHRHPGLYPLVVRAAEPEEVAFAALADEMLQMLLLMMASLGWQGEDALHAIRELRAILHGFVSLEAAGGFKMALDLEESFRRLVDGFVSRL